MMQSIRLCGRIADKLRSRNFGRRDGKCVLLSYEVALYIAERKIVDLNFKDIFREASREHGFDIRFFVYRDLRSRGYVIEVDEDHYRARKSYSMKFYPLSDSSTVAIEDLLKREHPHALAVVDGDGDVTYYMVDIADPRGNVRERVRVNSFYPAGSRVFLLDNFKNTGTFGKDEGEFGHLSNYEAKYLLGDAVDVDLERDIYRVYEDLRNRGLIVKSGFKYGTHFRVYVNSLQEHSRYLVHVLSGEEELPRMSRAVRVAHGVRKDLLLAGLVDEKVVYFSVSWIRP